ncbi:ACT domain-containing protein [Fusobacterium sp. PH5-44]|uniref:ACT domain-containing protein n=1 Tax=unclassified Fusobacterium TaxID=2648384 RepID=UPI003D23FD99
MSGEKNLDKLLKTMKPELNQGEYVYSTVKDTSKINPKDIIMFFKEKEDNTVILAKSVADKLDLNYQYVCAWITLTVHSSLEAVGLTAAFSKALGDSNISCNVVAGYYHDHIFVDIKDKNKAIEVLEKFAE